MRREAELDAIPLIVGEGDDRLELVAGSRAAGALFPESAVRALTTLLQRDRAVWRQLVDWPPLRRELERVPRRLEDALVELVGSGRVSVIAQSRVHGRHAPRPRPQPKPAPKHPQPQTTVVNPLIDADPVVVVAKPHRSIARRRIVLSTDAPFDGEGIFRCSSPALRFHTDASGGDALDAEGGVAFSGPKLTAGVTLFAEGLVPSATNGDVALELALHGGSKPVGPAARARLTVVDVQLDIFPAPGFADGGARLPDDEKARRGCFLHVNRDTPDEHWALAVVRRPQPADFDGTLELHHGAADLAVFGEDRRRRITASPIVFPPRTIAAAGTQLWLEGHAPHTSTLSISIQGVERDCEVVKVEVVHLSFSQSEIQLYGYDDMDRQPGVPHHLSVKSGGHTFVRTQLRGKHDRDAIWLEADNPASVAPLSNRLVERSTDVRIDGAPDLLKEATPFYARMHGPRGPRCAEVVVHVYRERFENVLLIRVEDPTSPRTKLGRWFDDLRAEEDRVNRVFRQAVARVAFTVHDDAQPVPIAYDRDGSGALTDDTPAGAMAEDQPFAPLAGAGRFTVVVVHDLERRIRTGPPSFRGDRRLRLAPEYAGNGDALVHLGGVFDVGERQETLERALSHDEDGMVVLAAPLEHDHDPDTPILLPLRGFQLGNLMIVEDIDFPLLIWIVAHELGHGMLGLEHQLERGNLMTPRAADGAGATRFPRLRFKPMVNDLGQLESQWDAVDRSADEPPSA